MKLDRKQDLNVLYQVCVFRADRKTKMASDWRRHIHHMYITTLDYIVAQQTKTTH